MAFRERMRPASFRGVPFWVLSHSASHGRRVAVQRFAGRDGSRAQDRNLESSEFDVVAYVWGPDYDLMRDQLEAELLAGGAGALVIPQRPDLWVRVLRGPVTTETKDEGGYCQIRFSVIEEERDPQKLVSVPDTRGSLLRSSDRLSAEAAGDFAARFDARNLPLRYLANALAVVDALSEKLRSVQQITQSALRPVTALTASIEELRQVTTTLIGMPSLLATNVVDLILTTFALHDTLVGAVDRQTGLPAVLLSAFDRGEAARRLHAAQEAFAGLGEPFRSVGMSALALRADENTRATMTMTRASALAALARGYADATFDSASFALEALEGLLVEIDALGALEPGELLFAALDDLRASLTRHILGTASRLPETMVLELPRALPALLVAFELYGDATRESDLLARNTVPRPLFMQGRIEALSP